MSIRAGVSLKEQPMLETIPLEVRDSVDIGSHQHRVAISLSSGEVLEDFDILHRAYRLSQ